MTVNVSENWMKAMESIADHLRAQNLEDIGGDVHVQSSPFTKSQTRPGCYISPEKRKTNESLSTNERDAVGYGCKITVIRGSSRSLGDSPDRVTKWQEVAARLFNKKRFWCPRSADNLYPARVETPEPAEDDEATQDKPLDATSIVVRAWVLENRS